MLNHRCCKLWWTFLLASFLAVAISWALTGCVGGADSIWQRRPIPQLLGVVQLPPEEIGSGKVVVMPGGYAYVLNWSDSVAILDGARLVKMLYFTGEGHTLLSDIAVDAATGLVYVSDELHNSIYVIHETAVVTTLHDIGANPRYMVVHPDTGYLYISNGMLQSPNDENVNQTDVAILSSTEIITRVLVRQSPQVLAINPTNQQVYLGQQMFSEIGSDSILTIISGTSVLTSTLLGYELNTGGVLDIAFDANTGDAYMIQNQTTIIYFDGEMDVRRINLFDYGGFYALNNVGVDPIRGLAYVGVQDGPPSHLIVLRKNEVVEVLRVGFDPWEIVYDETHDYIYVANRLSSQLSILRGTEIVATLPTFGAGSTRIGVDEVLGYIYISNADSHSITVYGYTDDSVHGPQQPASGE